jgi:ABC-2 type transport system permease protein
VTALRNITALVQKEWRHYFGSPIAYVALAAWNGLFGLFYLVGLIFFVRQSLTGRGMGMRLNDWIIAQTLQTMAVVTIFVAPMLTMRLFAEEKRQGTMELLATAPITSWQIILGKFFGALGLYAAMLLSSLLNFSLLWAFSESKPEWRPVATAALALLLLGATLIGVGQFLSSLTRNQVVAGVTAFLAALVLWGLSWLDDPAAGSIEYVVAQIGLLSHLEDLMKGVIDLKHVFYYVSFTLFGLFLTHQSLETQRWRA